MPTVEEDPDAYQSLDAIKQRVDYDGAAFFDDNEHLRFDELLVRLEEEARGLIETRSGDETFALEEGRVDEFRATDDAALPLVYPIRDVQSVEFKRTMRADWTTLEPDRYDYTDHRLVLDVGRRRGSMRLSGGVDLTSHAERSTWMDLARKLRVTYDRGFDPVPADIRSVQIDIINRLLRTLRSEQNIGAMEPDQLQSVTTAEAVLTDDIRERIDQVTGLGGKSLSV